MIDTKALFEAFSDLKILVLGDVMIDRYLSGYVGRISPEAPVPVVQLQSSDNRLGGAANVALNIRQLGAEVILCSVIGSDENGKLFRELLPEAGLSVEGLLSSSDRVTTVKTRVLASNQQLLRVDREDTFDLSKKECDQMLRQVRSILDRSHFDLILFQDYNKGVLTPPLIRELIAEAQSRNIPSSVDPKKKNFWAYQGVSLFKPNLKEVRDSLPFPVSASLASLEKAARVIREKLGNRMTLITLGERGLFIQDGQKSELLGTQARRIADVCGAGDTVISVASLGLAAGLEHRDIALLANLAGGQVCERVGVVPVDRQQLEREYEDLLALEKRELLDN